MNNSSNWIRENPIPKTLEEAELFLRKSPRKLSLDFKEFYSKIRVTLALVNSEGSKRVFIFDEEVDVDDGIEFKDFPEIIIGLAQEVHFFQKAIESGHIVSSS